jgi:hypothetical protein
MWWRSIVDTINVKRALPKAGHAEGGGASAFLQCITSI